MRFEIEYGNICKVDIVKGCPGNILGISKILENKTIEEVLSLFQGITCRD